MTDRGDDKILQSYDRDQLENLQHESMLELLWLQNAIQNRKEVNIN